METIKDSLLPPELETKADQVKTEAVKMANQAKTEAGLTLNAFDRLFSQKPWLKFVLLGLFGVLIILLAIQPFLPRQTTQPMASIEPAASPAASPPTNVSAFSQTPEFRAFESKLNELKQQVETVDLTESKLSFPLLDMNVNYE